MTRVRFAPSPTGYLHIGGARTALFNYLFAKHTGGKFILRIEDTDKERSTQASLTEILEALKWLGLDWDEGPGKGGDESLYFQTKRLPIYHKFADKLLSEGKAYKCFCTKEELDAARKQAEASKTAFKYSGKCRNLTAEEVKKNEAAGKPFTVRLKVEQTGEIIVNDIVRGEVRVQNATLDDMIILRADKMPIYNFVVVVDDAEMGITHVIRGEDHLSNTPKQIHMYNALGFPIPQFAHIPLILGQDKSKLSKRHGEVAVLKYREKGYLPEAMINYLAMLGWSPEGTEDILTMEQIIEKFTLERVHKAGAMFDNAKLQHINGVYIRKMGLDELTEKCLPYLKASGMADDPTDKNYVKKITGLQQEKLKTLAEISDLSVYFFKDDYPMTDEAKKTWEKNAADRGKVLEIFKKIIEEEGVDKAKVEERLRRDAEAAGIKPKVYMHVIRVALTGSTMGPGLFDIAEALGKEKTLARINKSI
jgi:glutamyl-tRNA synthetase